MFQFLTVTADNASAILLAFKDNLCVPNLNKPALDESNSPGFMLEPSSGGGGSVTQSTHKESDESDDDIINLEDSLVEQDLITDEDIEDAMDAVIAEWSLVSATAKNQCCRRNSCLAHLLQLAIKDAMSHKEDSAFVKKVNSIVTWFHKTNKYYTSLREASGLALVKPCDTRWNSTYHCLKRLSREILVKESESGEKVNLLDTEPPRRFNGMLMLCLFLLDCGKH